MFLLRIQVAVNSDSEKTLKRWVMVAPLIFALHFVEEAPGFVDWANTHVDEGISQRFFLIANSFVLGITCVVAFVMWISPSSFSAYVVTLWLSFIMLANGLLHIFAGIIEHNYVPGLITASVLYIPYYLLLMRQLLKRKLIHAGAAMALAVIGAAPMFIQGYRVMFMGTRLW